MAAVLQQCGAINVAQASNITRYFFPGCGPISATATESQRQVKARVPGVCSRLHIKVTANDRPTSTMRFRKNTANGTQSVTITASTAGTFEDLSGTDSLADGDLFNYSLQTGNGGTTFTFSAQGHLFAATTNSSQYLLGTIGANIGAIEYVPINGSQSGSAEANIMSRIYAPSGGYFKKFQVYVSTNTRDGTCTATFRSDLSDVSAIPITASTTGYFEDLSTTWEVIDGSTAAWIVGRGGTTGNCLVQYVGCSFESTAGEFLLISCGGTNTHGPSTSTYYTIMGGVAQGTTTEADAQTRIRLDVSLYHLKVLVQTNSISAASSMMVRVAGFDTGVSAVIDASTTGEFEDLGTPAAVGPTDGVCVRLTTGGTGTALAFRNFQMAAVPIVPDVSVGSFFFLFQ